MDIFANPNWTIFLVSIIPTFIYVFVAYLFCPYRSVKLKHILNYIMLGVLSTNLVLLFNDFLPNWSRPVFTTFDPIVFTNVSTTLTVLFSCFIQVALVEEVLKWVSFRVGQGLREKGMESESFSSIVIYMMSVGAGFGIAENISYGLEFGEQVAVIRIFTIVLFHVTLGSIMGYFISLSKQHSHKTSFPAIGNRPKLKKWIGNILGIGLAIIFHGFYNFNLSIGGDYTQLYQICILTGSLILSILFLRNAIKKDQD